MSDFSYIFHWWIILFIFGVFFLPLSFFIFKNFFDRGYIFSKVLGMASISYVVFLLGTLHITPFTQWTTILIAFLCGGVNIYLFRKHFRQLKKYIVIFLFEELLFFLGLWTWAYVRGFTPDIHELEKFMDFGFVNSILRSTYFPPKDMWFTPYPINYYYFGHFVTAVLTKISGIPSNITFNLMLATLFSFCFSCSFSLAANLWYTLDRSVWEKNKEKFRKYSIFILFCGILSGILVTFAGNLHILYAFFKSYGNDNPVPLWQLPFLPQTFPNAYWYPNATRFIYHTIHEFPMYSFVVSDLHGHVLDIPFVLLTIAVLFSVLIQQRYYSIYTLRFTSFNKTVSAVKTHWYMLMIGFLLAIMYMTNAWDGLMYFLLAMIVLCVVIMNNMKTTFLDNTFLQEIIPQGFIIFIGYLFFSLPFSLFFKVGEIAHGIGVLCAPKFLTDKQQIGPFLFEANHCQHSPWWQLMILYGFFYIWAIPFIIFVWRKWKITKKTQTSLYTSDIFVVLLILFSTFLIIVPEFFYLKDIYPEHYRANTMFKLVYQAFMMLSISSGYIILRFLVSIARYKQKVIRFVGVIIYIIPTAILIVLVAGIYPYYAITSYYGNLQTYHSLDGTAYLKTLYPTDYDAINWINQHISGQPVILEAQGDSYTDYARVSANTGLPTVLGWTVHEWLWRGSYDVPAPRITDVQILYETSDIPTAESLIKRYNIQYVFIGDMEKKKYPNLNINKFNTLGKIIYHNGTTMIYQIQL